MPRNYYSPYAPRRPRSARLVLLWLATFALILWVTWYIGTRHRAGAKPYVEEFLHPGSARRGVHDARPVKAGGGAAEEGAKVGAGIARAAVGGGGGLEKDW